jgi:hypothetical protein
MVSCHDHSAKAVTGSVELSPGKEVIFVEWIMPDFEEYETECEVTAYAYHW